MSYVCLYLKNGQQVTGCYKETEKEEVREGLLKQDIISDNWISLTPAVLLKVLGVNDKGNIVLDAMPFPLGGTTKTPTTLKGGEICGYCFFDKATSKYLGELIYPSTETKKKIEENIKRGIEQQRREKEPPLIIPAFMGQIPPTTKK